MTGSAAVLDGRLFACGNLRADLDALHRIAADLDRDLTAAEVAAKPDQATEAARLRMRASHQAMKNMTDAEQAKAWRDRQKAAA